MSYQSAVSETWRHYDLTSAARDYTNLVRYATLAASSHNTQPWKFKLERGRISIFPDLSRRCPVVDPDDHHLYASLGCAAGNLLEAVSAAGLRGHFTYDASTSGVHVDLEQASPSPSTLFEAIPRRQCSRATYDGTEATAQELRLLEEAGRGNGVLIMLLTTKNEKERVAEYRGARRRSRLFLVPSCSLSLR